MSEPIRGSCRCGAVRFQLVPPSLFCAHCHCESCRRVHGAAFITWTAVPTERFHFVAGQDRLVSYRSSDHATRSFCGVCGTHVHYVSIDWPGKVYVPVATLTDPLDREPECHVNVAEAVSWCVLGDGLPRYTGFDEETGS